MTDDQNLTTKSYVVHPDTDGFDKFLEEAGDKPVMVDFYADWCGPCRMAAPVIEMIAEDYKEKAVVAKVNVDENGELAQRFGVMSIPTVIVFKDSKPVDTKVGFAGEEGYTSMLDSHLDS